MLKINRKNLRSSPELKWFVLDFAMLGLLIINLAWIIFDIFYSIGAVQGFLEAQAPWFVDFYAPIHQNFIWYDLIFVAIFLTDFGIRWVRAVHYRIYERWYFFPFIHWYDLIGCIPVGGVRLLRFLRIFSIFYRLNQYDVIDITETRPYRFIDFYYDVFLEEISDRIVIKILSGTQEELRHGTPIVHKIQQEILLPRRDLLVNYLSERLAEFSISGYMPNAGELRSYLESVVDDAMESDKNLKRVRMIPMLGPAMVETLERSVADVVTEALHRVFMDLADQENHGFIDELSRSLLGERPHEETEIDRQFLQMIIEALDLVKDQVSVKRWLQELREEGRNK